jgi:hypothetical protein
MFLLPVIGQKFIEVAGGIFSKSLNDVGQIGPGLDAVASASGENRENNSMIFGTFVAAVKQPGMLPHSNVFHFSFCMIIVDTKGTIVDILCKLRPVVEAIEQSFAERAFRLGEGVLFLAICETSAKSASTPALA